MRVIVPNHPVEVSTYNDRDTGQPRQSRKQIVAVQSEDMPFPLPFKISLRPDEEPYAPGDYTLSASSFQLENGRLALSYRIVLVPADKK